MDGLYIKVSTWIGEEKYKGRNELRNITNHIILFVVSLHICNERYSYAWIPIS